MTIQKLAEATMDQIKDDELGLKEFVVALVIEAASQAARAAKDADDYTAEELDFWSEVAVEARHIAAEIEHAAHLVWAIECGLFGDFAKDSAFVVPLREALQ